MKIANQLIAAHVFSDEGVEEDFDDGSVLIAELFDLSELVEEFLVGELPGGVFLGGAVDEVVS